MNKKADGKVGEQTLAAINDYPDQQELFDRIKAECVAYIERIRDDRNENDYRKTSGERSLENPHRSRKSRSFFRSYPPGGQRNGFGNC